MRTLLILILIFSFSFAQNTEKLDVVYLKDGSIIKGKIIEIIPDETVKIETVGGNVFVFKMLEVEKIKIEFVSTKDKKTKPSYNPNKYNTQKNVGRYGFACVLGATLIGSAAMGDAYFGTTVIPIVGPFITMNRIEGDPGASYLPGGKELLIISGTLQVAFFSYWMIYLIKDAQYKSSQSLSIIPNIDNVGFTLSYTF